MARKAEKKTEMVVGKKPIQAKTKLSGPTIGERAGGEPFPVAELRSMSSTFGKGGNACGKQSRRGRVKFRGEENQTRQPGEDKTTIKKPRERQAKPGKKGCGHDEKGT